MSVSTYNYHIIIVFLEDSKFPDLASLILIPIYAIYIKQYFSIYATMEVTFHQFAYLEANGKILGEFSDKL